MDLVGQSAYALLQLADDQRVDIFVSRAREKLGAACLVPDRVEPCYELRSLRGREDTHTFKTPRERLRAANVRVDQPLVKMERTGKPLEHLRGTLLEPAAPKFHTDFFADFLAALFTAA